jgi:O-antigen/teichoic acid export membrane protein
VLLKIFFASALVLFGGGVEGAVTGVALSVGLVFLAGYSALRPSTRTRAASRFEFNRSHLKAVIPVLVANIAFAAMTQMDIVLVNYFFDREAAGSFAAAATLGKAILYLPGGIALALFPMVAERSARSERALGLLVQAVGMVFALCLAGAVFYLVVGEPLMTALFGTRYAGAGAILRYYGFAILPMTLLMVVEYFLIAKGKVFFAYLFLIGAPLQIATVCFFHKTLLSVIVIMGSFGVGLLLIGGVALYGSVRRDRLYSA